jgi:hypothetical protein
MLNQGWVGVTHGVWLANVSRVSPADADAVAGTEARAGAVRVPRRSGTATASVQRADRAQRVDTGRG